MIYKLLYRTEINKDICSHFAVLTNVKINNKIKNEGFYNGV